MKISRTKTFRNIFAGAILTASAITITSAKANGNTPTKDVFVQTIENTIIPPSGTNSASVLQIAPNPQITIQGEKKKATIIVDLSQNILYHYDESGEPICAYLVASGKQSTPTSKGVRLVTHTESFPYKTAPINSKRRKHPRDYGPKIICLETINPETGEKGITGEFIHGNNNPKSIGKYISHGCIRMDNEVIKYLASQVKRGDIVVIK